MLDLNPILDEGNPTSTAGITAALKLCEVLGITFEPKGPRAEYSRGWGHLLLDLMPIICSRALMFQDLINKSVANIFGLTDDNAPSTMGLDLEQFSKRDFTNPTQFICFNQPQDKEARF